MIELKHIAKRYGILEVLKGVDLFVERGEMVSIVGKSGAGKSTLLHIAGLLDKPDKGQVYIKGVEASSLAGNKLAHFRNAHMGFIFQFHHLLPEFTAEENIMMPSLIAGEKKKAALLKAGELLEYLGLEDRRQHKPSELSGGEQQRVAIGRALINKPDVLFADEPTGNLDSAISREIHDLFLNMRKDFDQTFLIVTHNVELASMTDRNLVMQDGKIVSE
jgi:lipoprotein-releasing system ATP-binding protein